MSELTNIIKRGVSTVVIVASLTGCGGKGEPSKVIASPTPNTRPPTAEPASAQTSTSTAVVVETPTTHPTFTPTIDAPTTTPTKIVETSPQSKISVEIYDHTKPLVTEQNINNYQHAFVLIPYRDTQGECVWMMLHIWPGLEVKFPEGVNTIVLKGKLENLKADQIISNLLGANQTPAYGLGQISEIEMLYNGKTAHAGTWITEPDGSKRLITVVPGALTFLPNGTTFKALSNPNLNENANMSEPFTPVGTNTWGDWIQSKRQEMFPFIEDWANTVPITQTGLNPDSLR